MVDAESDILLCHGIKRGSLEIVEGSFFKPAAMFLKESWLVRDCSIKILSESVRRFCVYISLDIVKLLSNRHTALSIIKESVTDLNLIWV